MSSSPLAVLSNRPRRAWLLLATVLVASCAGAHRSDLLDSLGEPVAGGPGEASREAGVGAGSEAQVEAGAPGGGGATTDGAVGSADASAAGGAAPDAAVPVGGHVDASTGSGQGEVDAGTADAATALDAALRTDAGPPVSYTPDACLASTYVASCDASCSLRNCRMLECTDIPTDVPALGDTTLSLLPWRFRTAATTDALACAPRCGGATAARGVVRFALDFSALTNLTIRVAPPWRIAVNPRYAFCVNEATAASSTSSCVSREFKKAMITVFTTEPNAPPRDIVVDRFPRLYCTETP